MRKEEKKINIPFFIFIAIVAFIPTFKNEHISTCNNNRKSMIDTTFCKTLSLTDALMGVNRVLCSFIKENQIQIAVIILC